jgi:hypothetical protein
MHKFIVLVTIIRVVLNPMKPIPQPPDSSMAIVTLLAHLGMGLPSGLLCFISLSETLYVSRLSRVYYCIYSCHCHSSFRCIVRVSLQMIGLLLLQFSAASL